MKLAALILAADLTVQMTGMGVVKEEGKGIKVTWLADTGHHLVLSADTTEIDWDKTTARPDYVLPNSALWVVKQDIQAGDPQSQVVFTWTSPNDRLCPTDKDPVGDLGWLPNLTKIFDKKSVAAHAGYSFSVYQGRLDTSAPLSGGFHKWKVIDDKDQVVQGAPYQAYTDTLVFALSGVNELKVGDKRIVGKGGLNLRLSNLAAPEPGDTNEKLKHFAHYKMAVQAQVHRFLKYGDSCSGQKRLGKPIFCPPGTLQ